MEYKHERVEVISKIGGGGGYDRLRLLLLKLIYLYINIADR